TGLSNRTNCSTARDDQFRRGAQTSELIRMLKQRKDRVADEVRRRFVAGKQEQDAHGDQFLVVQPVAIFLDLDQAAEQIIARVRPPGRDELTEVGDQLALTAVRFDKTIDRGLASR